MALLRNVEISKDGYQASFDINCSLSDAVALRSWIYNSTFVYAIDTVQYINNDTIYSNPVLALIMGLQVVNNEGLVNYQGIIELELKITSAGKPVTITSDTINNNLTYPNVNHYDQSLGRTQLPAISSVKLSRKGEICILRKEGSLWCRIFLKKSKGSDHLKWQPVSIFTFKESEEGFHFTMESVGHYHCSTLLGMIERYMNTR